MNPIHIKEIPEEFFTLNTDGTFKPLEKGNERLMSSKYWADKTQSLGIIMFLSMLGLTAMLLFETRLIETFWVSLLGVIGL